MRSLELVKEWFTKWEQGDFHNLPITDDFKHTSPYGTIKGKEDYINLVEANKGEFLNHRFEILDGFYEELKACVRYTAIQNDLRLEVSEWYYIRNDLIWEIVAYYNIDEERIKLED